MSKKKPLNPEQFSKLFHCLYAIPELSLTDIVVFSHIHSLASNEDGYCVAMNDYLVALMNKKICDKTMSRTIAKLERLNLFVVWRDVRKNSQYYTMRKIWVADLEVYLKYREQQHTLGQIVPTTLRQIFPTLGQNVSTLGLKVPTLGTNLTLLIDNKIDNELDNSPYKQNGFDSSFISGPDVPSIDDFFDEEEPQSNLSSTAITYTYVARHDVTPVSGHLPNVHVKTSDGGNGVTVGTPTSMHPASSEAPPRLRRPPQRRQA